MTPLDSWLLLAVYVVACCAAVAWFVREVTR